uniref:Uncharacterized protein n=1 Tax=Fagus sylvatica TaxID=28930 RepID=A0A2N9IXV8_FAGSY
MSGSIWLSDKLTVGTNSLRAPAKQQIKERLIFFGGGGIVVEEEEDEVGFFFLPWRMGSGKSKASLLEVDAIF